MSLDGHPLSVIVLCLRCDCVASYSPPFALVSLGKKGCEQEYEVCGAPASG